MYHSCTQQANFIVFSVHLVNKYTQKCYADLVPNANQTNINYTCFLLPNVRYLKWDVSSWRQKPEGEKLSHRCLKGSWKRREIQTKLTFSASCCDKRWHRSCWENDLCSELRTNCFVLLKCIKWWHSFNIRETLSISKNICVAKDMTYLILPYVLCVPIKAVFLNLLCCVHWEAPSTFHYASGTTTLESEVTLLYGVVQPL